MNITIILLGVYMDYHMFNELSLLNKLLPNINKLLLDFYVFNDILTIYYQIFFLKIFEGIKAIN